MQILHVVSTLERGGIGTSLCHLLPQQTLMPDIGVEAAVFYETGAKSQQLAGQGIPIHNLRLIHKYDPFVFLRLFRLIHTGRYDVIQVHGWPAVFFVSLLSLVIRRPAYLLTEHSVTNRRRRLGLKLLDRFIYSRFQAISAVSQAAVTALAAWLPEVKPRITMIHNGLDASRLRGQSKSRAIMRAELDIDENVPLIITAGTLDHHKGLDVLLHALPQFLSLLAEADDNRFPVQQPPIVLVAGDGILRKSLEELAAALGLTERVRFIGYRDDLPVLMSAADLFVLSSRWEGCPMAVLEAMTLGVPIVATGVGGVPELVLHNETGLVVAPENPNEMAVAMFDLLSNPEKAYCLARAGQDRLAKCFSVQRSADCLAKVYEQIAGERSR